MKSRFVDPFTPSRPIDDPERFFGRVESVSELVDSLFQIMNRNPKHTIITGDRGVGKSSLLIQIARTAEGDNRLTDALKIDRGLDKYDFLTVWQDVDSTQNVFDLSLSILNKFESSFTKFVSGFKLDIDLAGYAKLGYDKAIPVNLTQMIDEFVNRLKKVESEALKNKKGGVIIFIDELDRIKPDSMISSFFKLVTERLARESVKQTGFICAGITGAIQKLEEEHASILRTFRDVPLPRFDENEVENILMDGFNRIEFPVEMHKLGIRAYEVSVGLPEPVHLLGSEMISVDTDGTLRDDDFNVAIKKIVTDVRRNKLSSLLKKAGGGKYQKILEAMSKYKNKIVPLDYIAKHISQEQSQFSTNMGTLVDREILFKPSIGYYSFTDPMLKEYIKAFGVLILDE